MNQGRKEYTFLWFVENYSYCWHTNGMKLVSPDFTADGLEGTMWRLHLYPRGDDGYKEFVSLYLHRSGGDEGPESVSIDYELSVLGAKEPKTRSTDDSFKRDKGIGWGKFLQVHDLITKDDYLPQDILTVRCKMWRGAGNVRKVAPISARTRIAVENISFLRIVENFSAFQSNQKKTVEIRSQSKIGFVLSNSLYFADESCSDGNIMIETIPSDCNYILCKQKVSLLDGSGNITGCGENDNRIDVERKDIQKLLLSLRRQDILTKKSEYLPDGKLTLLCECAFSTGLEFEKIEGIQQETSTVSIESSNKFDSTAERLSAFPTGLEDIKTLYINQRLTDMKLETKTKSFSAHKIVLCARSPVFEAMMTSDMKEKQNNCIKVDDLEDETVEQLLLFLYSDDLDNLQWNTAIQLYYAADKYEIGKLKELCSSFLLENLTTSNVTELLLLADTHNDSDLKEVVENFILEHEKQVFGSNEWEKLIETNSLLVIKTMHLKYKKKK